MKWFLIFVLLVSSTTHLWAQQSYFNVPSSEITCKNKVFFQEQLNFNQDFVSNTTFDFGLTKYLEVGVNILNYDYSLKQKHIVTNSDLSAGAYSPLYVGNINLKLNKNEYKYFTVGCQIGAVSFDKHNEPSSYFFLNYKWKSQISRTNAVVGFYYGDQSYLGIQNAYGIQLGFEYELNNKVHLMADALIGKGSISNSVFGFVYYVKESIPLSLGYLLPVLSKDKPALVFEFTFCPL